jgi:hypothetical protein
MTLMQILIVVGIGLVLLFISTMLFLAFAVFLGAATMGDMHDDYPPREDFNYDKYRKNL